MRNFLLTLLSLTICTATFSQESREARRSRRGQAAGYASRDATVMSMMGWGIGLAVGIAALCALIENETGSSSSSSSSSSGGSSTSH